MPHPALIAKQPSASARSKTARAAALYPGLMYEGKPIVLDSPSHGLAITLLSGLFNMLCPMRDFVVRHYAAGVPNLPHRLDGLTLVQLSDIQCYEYAPVDYWKKMIREVRRLDPDILVITGDIIHHGGSYLKQAHDILSALPKMKADGVTPVERLLCMGNHDYMDHDGKSEIGRGKTKALKGALFRQLAQKAGFTVLVDNAVCFRHNSNKPDDGLWISGVDDYEHLLGSDKNLDSVMAETVSKIPSKAAHLMLTHNPHPDIIDRASRSFDKAPGLILSGHMHGGQIASDLPWLGPMLTKLRRRVMEGPFNDTYLQGAFRANGSALYVSPGIGSSIRLDRLGVNLFPLRVGSTPEITRFTLHPARESSLKNVPN